MVFKIQPASGTDFHAVAYNEKKIDKNVAQLLYMQHFGRLQGQPELTKLQLQNFLISYSQTNKRIKNPAFHASLSCKGQEYSNEELVEFAKDIMEKMGYGNQPMLIYGHSDTDNNHVHIVATRVDSTGRKINDKFEKKRANSYLNAIMNRHPTLEFEARKNLALRYSFSTVAQFNLIMESGGYKIRKKDGIVNYYKHGSQVGTLKESDIQLHAKQDVSAKQRISQVRALIGKYQQVYSPELKIVGIKTEKDAFLYNGKDKKFHSELSDYLKDKFGLEFVYFSAKDYDKPYGYAIIDHKDKAVYKGSEVRKLEQLISGQSVDIAQSPLTPNKVNYVAVISENQIAFTDNSKYFDAAMLKRELNNTIEEIATTDTMKQNNSSSKDDDLLKLLKKKRNRR